jgi:hypothetical protein
MSNVRILLKRFSPNKELLLLKSKFHLTRVFRPTKSAFEALAVSILSVTISATILFVPTVRMVVDGFKQIESVLAQLGATFGTILALVLTLSIIPVQRAGEVWSPSIVRLYRRDPATHVTFILLGMCCVLCFTVSIRGIVPTGASLIVSFTLLALGTSIDILRWYHGHICRMLDPAHVVNLVLMETKKAIDSSQSAVTRASKALHHMLDNRIQIATSINQIESAVYPKLPGYPDIIVSKVRDLAEIACKGVSRGELLLVELSVKSIAEAIMHFMTVRKNNLTFTNAVGVMNFVRTPDIDSVTTPAYDALLKISHVAVRAGDEVSAIHVSMAYQQIAIHSANLNSLAIESESSPLTFSPLYYAFESVKYAQSKSLKDVAFRSADILIRVPLSAPRNIAYEDIHSPTLEGIYNISIYLYVNTNYSLAEITAGHMFTLLKHLLVSRDQNFCRLLETVFNKLEALAPLSIANESMQTAPSSVYPLWMAYGLTNENSIGYLFEIAAEQWPSVDPDREWVNPYHELIDVMDSIKTHFRKLADKVDFKNSMLLWELDQLVNHIVKVVIRLLGRPVRNDGFGIDEVIDKINWIISFYWAAFDNKTAIHELHMVSCCESLAKIGLLFLECGHPAIARDCIDHIKSILESYIKTTKPINPYTMGDIYSSLWCIRLVTLAMGMGWVTTIVETSLNEKPSGLDADLWVSVQEAIILRRRQIENRINQADNFRFLPDSLEFLVKRLIDQHSKPAGDCNTTA